MKPIICLVFHDLVKQCTRWEDTTFDTFLEFYKSSKNLNVKMLYSFDDGYRSILKLYEDGHVTDFSDFWIFPVNNLISRDGYLTWDDIKLLISLGCRVGSHTSDHVDLLTLGNNKLLDELVRSRIEFERKLNIKNLYLSAPYGRVNKTIIKIALEAGFCGTLSSRPGFFNKGEHRLNRISLNENTINSFSVRFFWSNEAAILFEIFRYKVIKFIKLVFGQSIYKKIRNFWLLSKN